MEKSKKLKIDDSFLQQLETAFNDNSFMCSWYIDLQENKVTFISEDYDEDEELVEQIENDVDQERFIPIPSRPSRDGWRQMERFIDGLDDTHKQDILYIAIEGKGAFRRFKDALYKVDLIDEWHEFSNREDRAEVLEWLHLEGLIGEEDIEKGKQLLEETLAKRKRREANMQKMVQGATVICSDNYGHIDQITPGKIYQVLGEQKEHLNIRVNDDRGKTIWLPKSHFELVSEG